MIDGVHVSPQVARNDISAPSVDEHSVISNISLSILDDSGWYVTNRSLAEPLTWGLGQSSNLLQAVASPSDNSNATISVRRYHICRAFSYDMVFLNSFYSAIVWLGRALLSPPAIALLHTRLSTMWCHVDVNSCSIRFFPCKRLCQQRCQNGTSSWTRASLHTAAVTCVALAVMHFRTALLICRHTIATRTLMNRSGSPARMTPNLRGSV